MKKTTINLWSRAALFGVVTVGLRYFFDWPVIVIISLVASIIWETVRIHARWKLFEGLHVLIVLIPAYALLAIWERFL
jgi:accessory gene regulator protein AgrB